MALNITTIPPKTLARSIGASEYVFRPNNILSWKENTNLVPGDFGDNVYVIFYDLTESRIELMEIDPDTVLPDQDITVLKRGLGFNGDLTTENADLKLEWNKNETVIQMGAVTPQLLKKLEDTLNTAVVAGGVPAEVTVAGIGELSTTAEIDADTGTPQTVGHPLIIGLLQLAASKYNLQLPTAGQKNALAGSAGTPGAANKFLTEDDDADTATASKLIRALASGKIDASWLPITAPNPTLAVDKVWGKYIFPWYGNTTNNTFWQNVGTPDYNGIAVSLSSASAYGDMNVLYPPLGSDSLVFNRHDKFLEFEAKVNSGDEIFMGFHSGSAVPTSVNDTSHHIGFFIDSSGNVQASVADGTTQTKSSALTGFTLAASNTYSFVHTKGTDVKFYINGVLKATLTTNIPVNTSSFYIKFAAGGSGSVYVTQPTVMLKNNP